MITEAIDDINQNEALAGRMVYIGGGVFDYIIYALSTELNPYELDLKNNGIGSYHNFVFSLPQEALPESCYIVYDCAVDMIDRYKAAGLQMVDYEGYVLFY